MLPIGCSARPPWPGSLLVILLLAGCEGATGDTSDAGDADALPRLTLEEDLRIGSLEDPDVGFSRIAGVEVAADGSVFVLEAADRQVRVYDAAGTLLRRIGAQGAGPGELQSPSVLQLFGDTVVVSEVAGNARITLFSADGEVLRTVPAPSLPMSFPGVENLVLQFRPYRLRPDGRFEASEMRMVFGGGPPPQAGDSVRVPRLLFDSTGTRADTVGFYSMALPRSLAVGSVRIPYSSWLPASDLRHVLGSDTVLVKRPAAADAAEGIFNVMRISGAGDTLYHRRLRYTPRPVEPAYRDSVLDGRVSNYANRLAPAELGAARSALEAAVPWPVFHPPVASMWVGRDGSVWLRREATDSIPRWTVLGPDGSPRGEVLLSGSTSLQWSDGETVWAVERDDFDVPWLVRYRIRR